MTNDNDRYIQDGLDYANSKAVSNAGRVQKFWIAPIDFSVAADDLTATLKLKRPQVTAKYAKEIDKLYAEGEKEAAAGAKDEKKEKKTASLRPMKP